MNKDATGRYVHGYHQKCIEVKLLHFKVKSAWETAYKLAKPEATQEEIEYQFELFLADYK